ncbi:hypothetical protein COOONC_07876 [Cooperia oncophora]
MSPLLRRNMPMKTKWLEGDKLKLSLENRSSCFMVMGLVGSSLEDIRHKILFRDYSKPTAMNSSLQTLQAIWDLHETGYLHRVARVAVKFLGTIRFASRACHLGIEQGRKDDLETWLYMVITMKEKFIKLQYPKSFRVVPAEIRRIIQYIDGMDYADEPDYLYIQSALK